MSHSDGASDPVMLRTLLHSSCVQFTANGRNSDDTANQKVLLQLTEQFRAMQM